MHHTYYLSLGANMGDRLRNLQMALDMISSTLPDTRIMKVSDVYETEPVEVTEQPLFYNAVAVVTSPLEPDDMMSMLLGIESSLGRKRTIRFGPRPVDIDMLLCDDMEISHEPHLIVPHPRMHERAFVLIPLAQIAPSTLHPVARRTIADLLDAVGGKEGVAWVPKFLRKGSAPIES